MTTLSAICPCLLAACLAYADTPSDARLLQAIGTVESGMNYAAIGDNGRSFGAFQMQREAIREANALLIAKGQPRVSIRDMLATPHLQVRLASEHLAILRAKFFTTGIKSPTANQLALAWNKGFDGAKARGFAPTDYSDRVCNIILTIK